MLKTRNYRSRDSRCYEIAMDIILDNEEPMYLIHGFINGKNNSRIGHAWIQYKGQYYDGVFNEYYEKVYYIKHFNAEIVHRYNRKQASKLMLENKHSGPWDKNLEIIPS